MKNQETYLAELRNKLFAVDDPSPLDNIPVREDLGDWEDESLDAEIELLSALND